MELFTNRYETEEEFWRSVLTDEKPALPMGQVRKFFPYSRPVTGAKFVIFPFRGNRRGFLTYGASAPICSLIFVKNVKILLKAILEVQKFV